jgi:hypothetical protein
MPYLLKNGLTPHMSPSRLELCEAVLKNPRGPEPLGAVDGAGAAPAALTGCSTSSPELAGAGVAAALAPTGVSTNSPDVSLLAAASSAQAVTGCAARHAPRTNADPNLRAH